HIAAIADDDGRVARLQRLDQAEIAHVRDGVVVRAEIAEAGDVHVRAVGESRDDGNLDGFSGLREGVFGRGDRDLLDVAGALVPAGTVQHPLFEDAVLPRVLAEADAAGVLNLAWRLEQEQAALGIGNAHAPAQAVAGHIEVVALRLEAEQGEAKAALALEGPMARAAIAAHAAEEA